MDDPKGMTYEEVRERARKRQKIIDELVAEHFPRVWARHLEWSAHVQNPLEEALKMFFVSGISAALESPTAGERWIRE